jgi:hypothetical protein
MREPIEPRVNFVELGAGALGFPVEFGPALIAMVAAARIAFAAAFVALAGVLIALMSAFTAVATVLASVLARAARPFVLKLVVFIEKRRRLVVVFVVGLNDVVEPLADRLAGAARGRARGLACFGAQAS